MRYRPECGGEMQYAIAAKHYICESCGLSVTATQKTVGTSCPSTSTQTSWHPANTTAKAAQQKPLTGTTLTTYSHPS